MGGTLEKRAEDIFDSIEEKLANFACEGIQPKFIFVGYREMIILKHYLNNLNPPGLTKVDRKLPFIIKYRGLEVIKTDKQSFIGVSNKRK